MKDLNPVLISGQPAPDFTLPDLGGQPRTLSAYRPRIVVVNFWSAECPWVKRLDEQVATWKVSWGERVVVLNIAANDNEPPDLIRRVAEERGLENVLIDAQQKVADAYGALTTPHVFVVDGQGVLRYQGAADDVTFRQRTPTRFYLKDAVEALLAGGQPELTQTPSYGCTIVRPV